MAYHIFPISCRQSALAYISMPAGETESLFQNDLAAEISGLTQLIHV